jgi:hypothetical protein
VGAFVDVAVAVVVGAFVDAAVAVVVGAFVDAAVGAAVLGTEPEFAVLGFEVGAVDAFGVGEDVEVPPTIVVYEQSVLRVQIWFDEHVALGLQQFDDEHPQLEVATQFVAEVTEEGSVH